MGCCFGCPVPSNTWKDSPRLGACVDMNVQRGTPLALSGCREDLLFDAFYGFDTVSTPVATNIITEVFVFKELVSYTVALQTL